jgi:hypothetical protein
MKTIGIILITIALIGCAAGLIFMSQSLGATQERLETTESALTQAQIEQQSTAASLAETKSELADTIKKLDETSQGLKDQKELTDKYIQLYETSADELQSRERELEIQANELTSEQQANLELQETIDELQEKLSLYEDTLGTKVFSGITKLYYSSGNASFIKLINQPSAENPTWKELRAFLKEDKTDKKAYVPGVYECGNFAEELHNNAEAHGIRAAFVAVHFYDSPSHALNAFKTTDRGLVYIDDTGDKYSTTGFDFDKIVELSKDEIYSPTFLFTTFFYLETVDWKVKSIEIYW